MKRRETSDILQNIVLFIKSLSFSLGFISVDKSVFNVSADCVVIST